MGLQLPAEKIAGQRTEILAENAYVLAEIEGVAMFYRKNLPGWERAARVLGGAAMVACGFLGLPGMPIGYLIAGAGVVTVMTGFFGFCPMCAMAGRRLPSP